jgi:hypothetical protein
VKVNKSNERAEAFWEDPRVAKMLGSMIMVKRNSGLQYLVVRVVVVRYLRGDTVLEWSGVEWSGVGRLEAGPC